MTGVRYVFAHKRGEHVVEFTHPDGPEKSTKEWAASHQRSHVNAVAQKQPGHAIRVEVFESDVPVDRDYFTSTHEDR